MNTLKLNIKPDAYNSGRLELIIDGMEALVNIDKGGAAYFNELIASTIQTGYYLIFTCSCGVADCGGWDKIRVKHENESIFWDFEYNDIVYHFEFERDFYIGEIRRLQFELDRKGKNFKLQPEYVIEPE